MNCEECVQLLTEHLDGELPEKTEQEIQEHLETCRKCRKEMNILDRITSVAGELPRHTPRTETILKISESIHKTVSPQRRTEFGSVLDMDELADFLRVDKSVVDLYLDEIPFFELGGKLLFRRKSVEEWIERMEMRIGFQVKEPVPDSTMISQNIIPGGARWKI